jgi:very-short-patch-repair endonuclease
MAAVLACGPDAALSHRSAAALHGLRRHGGTRIDVTIPIRSGRAHAGIQIHRSTTLTPEDVTDVNGIPCTTVARTLFDLADVLSRRPHERAFDEAEVLDVFDLWAIQDQLQRNRGRRRAVKKVTALLNEHYVGSTPTRSELEEAFFSMCRKRDLPQPEVDQWILLPDGGPPILADFLFRAQRVVVETDGDKYHSTAQARERDPERDQRLTVHGYVPVRTTWRQTMRRPDPLATRLKRIIDAR